MICSLAHGDDASFLIGFGGDDNDDLAIQQAQGDESWFSIVETSILKGHIGFGFNNFWRIIKVKSVFFEGKRSPPPFEKRGGGGDSVRATEPKSPLAPLC